MTVHHLKATSETVRIGVIDNAFEPVLKIASGDEVVFETWQLWGDAVTPKTSFADVAALRERFKGKGPHSITGPVEIAGAKAGMVLRVDILGYKLRDYGFNVLLPRGVGRGLLKDDFDGGRISHFSLDTERMTTTLPGGITIHLKPFLGIMGVAPPGPDTHSSSIPGPFGGNMDCSELVAGSTLFLPIWVDGARFYAGDAHAAQGCGELNQTALETAMHEAHLRITLVDEPSLQRPRVETSTHLITMGFDEDVQEAARQATRDMIDLLSTRYGIDREDAYVLCSLQTDLIITQIVNGNNGVHARLARDVLPADLTPARLA